MVNKWPIYNLLIWPRQAFKKIKQIGFIITLSTQISVQFVKQNIMFWEEWQKQNIFLTDSQNLILFVIISIYHFFRFNKFHYFINDKNHKKKLSHITERRTYTFCFEINVLWHCSLYQKCFRLALYLDHNTFWKSLKQKCFRSALYLDDNTFWKSLKQKNTKMLIFL